MENTTTTPTRDAGAMPRVMKLPLPERIPAVLVAAGKAPVNAAPVAIEPTEASPFRTTGDSSPVIFDPSAGRAIAVYKPRKGGVAPIPPTAPAVVIGHHTRLIGAKSKDFAHFFDRGDWASHSANTGHISRADANAQTRVARFCRNQGGMLIEHHGARAGPTAGPQLQRLSKPKPTDQSSYSQEDR